MMLSDVCLSVAYIGPKSKTERPRKTKIGTEVAQVARDSDTTFKVRRSKGQGHQAALLTAALTRQAAAAVSERENVLAVGNCCYVAVCSAAEGASTPTGGGEGRGHTVAAARLQFVIFCKTIFYYSTKIRT